tara:strand:- start:445 stop:708 length:264 start_codon:yes stop_codon:yes gene_type:complete
MIKIDVCLGCESEGCCNLEKGIDLYEFIKSYLVDFIDWEEVEINLSRCKCMKICNGPIVKVNNKVYTNVNKDKALNIIKNIVLQKEV